MIELLPIYAVQGSELTSLYAGCSATVQGVVLTSDQGSGQVGDCYIEALDSKQNLNATMSEDIYCFRWHQLGER